MSFTNCERCNKPRENPVYGSISRSTKLEWVTVQHYDKVAHLRLCQDCIAALWAWLQPLEQKDPT